MFRASLDEKVKDAAALVRDGEQFFTPDNFKLISLFSGSTEDRGKLSNLKLSTLDTFNIHTSNASTLDVEVQSVKKLNRKERRKQQFGLR